MVDATEQPVEVLLYGLGAIGAFYAMILSRNSRVRLSVCARSNYEAVKANGLTIEDEELGTHTVRPFKVLRSPADAQQAYDYVVCCNKAVNTDDVLEQLNTVVDEERTSFAIMQNGVGNEVPFRRAFPKSTIISGVVWVGARQPTPGHVIVESSELTEYGLHPRDPNSPTQLELNRLQNLTRLFQQGGARISIPANIQTARWKKTIWNMAWNSLTALTGCDTQTWLTSAPDLSVPVTRNLMLEAVCVAQAVGVPGVEESLADELIAKVRTLGKLYSSMYWDKEGGRPMEVEVILGHAVREGRRLNVKTPTLECLYALLVAVDERMRSERKVEVNK